MENILAKLLEPDSSAIIQGTRQLREAFKTPEAIPALCNVLSYSNSPEIRQYAAVLLRKRLTKQKQWAKLSPDIQNDIKQGILRILLTEKEKFVKNSVAQFVAVIAKHEISKSNWPELLKLIQDLVTSSNESEVELGLFTLSVLTDIALDIFSENPGPSSVFFSSIFQSPNCLNTNLGYYTVMTMIHVVSLCESNPSLRNAYNEAIPRVIEIIKFLAEKDEEKACECMELFDEITEYAVPLLVPHVQPIIHLCLELAMKKTLGDTIRNKALTLIGWITRIKKKAIIKHKLIKPIVDVVFTLMCEPPDDEDDEEYFVDDEDDSTPATNANQTLDVLALHLPAQKLITPVLEHVSAGLAGDNLYVKKASYLALAMLAEGCADCIRTKCLKLFLECVCRGITDPAPVVRNAALFALGQFSEHLQPEISEYASELMPVLSEYLAQLCTNLLNDSKQPPGVDRMFYALEVFCENLEEKLLPYLPNLMERLLMTLKREHSVQIQELALSTIGAAASAVKMEILPFFPKIIENLKKYLVEKPEPETVCLQVQAIDTLGILARTLGPEYFGPLAQETMQLGMALAYSEDPDLRKATYMLFAALSTVMKEKISPYLPKIIQLMMESLKSNDGVMPHYKDDENAAFPVYEDLSDTPDEEDIENESEISSICGDIPFTVENAYIEEKESACVALKDIAQNTGAAFLPYLEGSFEEMYKLVNYPHDDIRKAAIEALAQFCINFSEIETPEGRQALSKSLYMVIPKCSELVRLDEERIVAISALESFAEMIKAIKRPVFEGDGHKAAIVNCIKEVLTYKTQCQDREEDEAECEDAEQDELLLETAGDIIPHLGEALGTEEFIQCMSELLPIIVEKLKSTYSVSQRSFFVATLAECMSYIKPELSYQAIHMLNIFLPLVRDEHPEVRSNAIYGLGELAFHAKEALYSHYNDILNALSNVLSAETNNSAIGNICGALARLIITNAELIPLDLVFPVFIQRLPLKEDTEEHAAVLKSFGHLYQIGHSILLKHLPDVIRICCSILGDSQDKPDVFAMAREFLKTSQKDFPAEFSAVMQTLPTDISNSISTIISSGS